MSVAGGFLSRLRRPEHTGENRCLPCTVLNVGIAAVASVLLGAATWSVGTAVAGASTVVVVFGLCAVTIYLRGYLVPGTPALTARYVPSWVLEAFGKAPETPTTMDDTAGQEAILIDANALEERPDGRDLRLAEPFRGSWYDAIDRVGADSGYEELFEIVDGDGGDVSVEEHGTNLQAHVDGQLVGLWKSRAAFLADFGGAAVLAEQYDGWDELTVNQRHEALSGLRLYIDRCPACGAVPEFGIETVETCCAARDVGAVECPDCGARLFEAPAD